MTSGTSYLRSIYTVYPQYYPEKNISELKLLFTNQHEKVPLWYSKACHSFIKMGSRKFEITHIFFTYKLMLISLILIYHDVFTASQPKFTRSKSTIETPEQCVKSVQSQWRRSDIFIVNYNCWIYLIILCSVVSILDFEQINAIWEQIKIMSMTRTGLKLNSTMQTAK